MRLGRILVAAKPNEPEVHGLLALMELQASRLRARTGPTGEPILLLDQNRASWDRLLIQRGLSALGRVEALGGALGPYTLQAALAACHARAPMPEHTDRRRIVSLYDALAAQQPSPVIDLNRAIAIGMADGPAAGLQRIDVLCADPSQPLAGYPSLWAARAQMLTKLGRSAEAAREFEHAASLTKNERERESLLNRGATARRHGQTQSRPAREGDNV